MKPKIYSMTLLLPLLLFSPAIFAQAGNEREYELAVTKAQYETELGHYDAAIGFLEQALALKPEDTTALVSLGIACSRKGDLAQAREVLKKAVDNAPADARARYELAVVLGKLAEREEANRQMALVLEKSSDEDLSAAAKAFLAKGGPGKKGKAFSLNLDGGFQYDSNVILEQDNPVAAKEKKADWRAVLGLNALYSLLATEKGSAEVGYRFYQSLHKDLTDFNVQQHAGRMAGAYALSNTSRLHLEYDFLYSFVGGDHYSAVHRFAPALSINLTQESLSAIHASYETKRFFNSNLFAELTDKNGSNTSAGLSHTIMPGKKTALAFDYTYDKDSASESFWSYKGNKATVSALSGQGPYRIFLTASYYDRKYEGLISGAPELRHDGTQEYSLGVTRALGKDVSVTFADCYTFNDSNLELYQYKRNIIGLLAELRL